MATFYENGAQEYAHSKKSKIYYYHLGGGVEGGALRGKEMGMGRGIEEKRNGWGRSIGNKWVWGRGIEEKRNGYGGGALRRKEMDTVREVTWGDTSNYTWNTNTATYSS